jgi:hypothetical protein
MITTANLTDALPIIVKDEATFEQIKADGLDGLTVKVPEKQF